MKTGPICIYILFYIQVTVHRDKFLLYNQLDALISQIYFWNKTLHVSDISSVPHQEFFTVHIAMVYVIEDQDGTAVPSWSSSQAVSKPVWHIQFLCVQRKTPNDGQRNCPKDVEFYSKNKFEKLVHLVGFIIRIYIVLLTAQLYTLNTKISLIRTFRVNRNGRMFPLPARCDPESGYRYSSTLPWPGH